MNVQLFVAYTKRVKQKKQKKLGIIQDDPVFLWVSLY